VAGSGVGVITSFLSQAAWAKSLGVSTRTFRRWREAGLIPDPADLPGHPRWSLDVVEQTNRKLRGRARVLFGDKGRKAVAARAQRGGNHSQFNRVSVRHASDGAKADGGTLVNSIEVTR
jgi:hypothetical protein